MKDIYQLKLVTIPDPRLIQPCENIFIFDENLNELALSMYQMMIHHKGAGLAAPQVGINKKIILAEFEGKKYILVNPIIVEKNGSESAIEGCLSIPGRHFEVERALTVKVEAQNLAGEELKIKETGFMARILQHEIDHLNGILITSIGKEVEIEEES